MLPNILRSLCLCLLVGLSATGTARAEAPAPATKWRVTFSGQAASTGQIQFRVTPQSGAPILVNVKITLGRGEFYIAKDLCEAFKSQLPKKIFKSEVVHGQEVLVKAGPGEPGFALELVESTVQGPHLHVTPS